MYNVLECAIYEQGHTRQSSGGVTAFKQVKYFFFFFLLLKEFLKYEKNKINRGMYDSKNRISTNRIWSKTGYLKKKQNKKTSRTSDSQKVVGNKLYKKYYVYKYRA